MVKLLVTVYVEFLLIYTDNKYKSNIQGFIKHKSDLFY